MRRFWHKQEKREKAAPSAAIAGTPAVCPARRLYDPVFEIDEVEELEMTRNEVMDVLIDCIAQIYKADKSGLSENTNLPETFGTNSPEPGCPLFHD